MARVFMSHKVADFDTWKGLFDADAERRKGMGMTLVGLYRSHEDGNDFYMVFDTEADAATARTMLEGMVKDPEMGEVMEKAGVLEPPAYWVSD